MMANASILLVDDETKILNALASALRGDGYEVVATVVPARSTEAPRPADVRPVIVDNLMPELTGLDLIRDLSAVPATERPQVIMMTAHATIESAIEAMKLGAFDYLQKPFEVDELLVAANRAIEHQRLQTEHRYLISERDADFNHYGIVGRSRRMQEVIKTAEVVAKSKSTVLITGETGTGKELVARAIHYHSAQREMPLIKVNCAAIPETLLECELFGHVRGAFTGATTSKKGKFALADGGTIFLDEIGTMSPALQAKLLRVLQEREFEPLGSERTQQRGRAGHRGHQPRPPADGGRRQVPGGSLLPAQRDPDPHPAAARAARRHPGARRPLRRANTRSARASGSTALEPGVIAALQALRLAGQRPRAREHDRARGRALPGADRSAATSRCSTSTARRRRDCRR